MKRALLSSFLVIGALTLSGCNGGGGGDDGGSSNTGQTGDNNPAPPTSNNAVTAPAAANGGSGNSTATVPANVIVNTLTAANHMDALRAVMELTFRRPMFFINGGVGHQLVFPHHFDYRTFGTIQPCTFGGKRSWAFNDENKNLALNDGETGVITYTACMQGQAGELQTNGTVLQTISNVYGKYTQDWNLTKDVPGRQLAFSGRISAEHVFKDDGTFVTGHERIDDFIINENGKPYIKTLLVDFKLWSDNNTPSTLTYVTGGGIELRGHTLHFSAMLPVDITGNFGTFNITIEDPESYSRVRYSQNANGEVVADYYNMGDVKPSSTSTFKWTDALPGGY